MQSSSTCNSSDSCFSDGRVDHSISAKNVHESLRHLVGSVVLSYLLTDEENFLVSLHFFANGGVEGVSVGEFDGGLWLSPFGELDGGLVEGVFDYSGQHLLFFNKIRNQLITAYSIYLLNNTIGSSICTYFIDIFL